MDSGWFKLAKEYFKDKGLSMQYHMMQEWLYMRFVFSHHERMSRMGSAEGIAGHEGHHQVN